MDEDLRNEILANEFADELGLRSVVNRIDGVYRALSNGSYYKNIEDDLLELKENLREKSKEHDKLHGKYGNWSDKFSIVHARRPDEETLVTAIWDLILTVENAYIPSDCSANFKMTLLLNEVMGTAEACGTAVRCFPLSYIVNELEEYCCCYEANPEKVQAALIKLNIPFRKLFNVYRRLDFFGDNYEDGDDQPFHFLKAFASLIQSFMQRNQYLEMSESDRQSVHMASMSKVLSILDEMQENDDEYNPRLILRYQRLYASLKNFSL